MSPSDSVIFSAQLALESCAPADAVPRTAYQLPGASSMNRLSFEDRMLGWRLGLGDLAGHEPCHGYANGCACSQCFEREQNPQPALEPVKQPWEARAA